LWFKKKLFVIGVRFWRKPVLFREKKAAYRPRGPATPEEGKQRKEKNVPGMSPLEKSAWLMHWND